ncbi:N-acetyltransferase [Duganella sp. CF517]|uniref:N-acyl amino acid synthase FeeM domain-containing protein n=1 Tax=Duganella sp. CF517 TaxID=1881038 RepID=UPI0015A56B9F|nr:N-acetyltransferase [Duganella sp. CF517]
MPRPNCANPHYYGPAIVPDVLAKLPPGCTSTGPLTSFGIHLANTEAGRQSAARLVNKMYRWRGYGDQHALEAHPHHVTLTAAEPEQLLGTVTLRTDSANGMLADATFKEVIDAYRRSGARVCEVTKLAIDPLAHPKLALATLVHIIYLYAYKIYACTDMFIEVNPRHKRFYEEMLGFEPAAEVRNNARVNAPAHLLRISLDFMGAQIARLGGTGAAAGGDTRRSLYPYFFCRSAEAGILSLVNSLSEASAGGAYEQRWAA